MPSYDVDECAAKLPKDGTWIVAYCACPHAASGRVAAALRDRGFKNVVVLDEGVGTARIDADPWGLREAVPRSS